MCVIIVSFLVEYYVILEYYIYIYIYICVCEREREKDYRIRVFFLGGILCNFGTGATNDPTIIIVRKLWF